MASKFDHFNHILFVLFSLFFTLQTKAIQATFKPNAFVLPVYKDERTSLYVTKIRMRTPQVLVPFLVDLNGKYLWVDCEKNYSSSTYNVPFCHSTVCSIAGNHYCHKCTSSTARPGCHNNTCAVITTNPLIRDNVAGEIASDVLSVESIPGSNPGEVVTIPHFIFTCAPSSLLQGPMPSNVQGIVGLGHTPVDLPFQLSGYLGIPPQFALCLPSSANKIGAIFIGKTPRKFGNNLDPSKSITYTPLMIGAEGGYFIQVRSIRINNKRIQLKNSLLSNDKGFSGTMLSTIAPFTVLEHSVFKAFTDVFTRQLSGVHQVKAVSPFEACFDSSELRNTGVGPQVPNIEFVMQNQNASWTISGANSMVQVRPGVSCLAFVDGGINTKSAIVIGAYQLQDHLLHFDIIRSRLGLSYSLC